MSISRRQALAGGAAAGLTWLLGPRGWAQASTLQAPASARFPAVPGEDVREVVRLSHFDRDKVAQLVDRRPHLANATMDWGYGDWETALGAAAHMGRRDIAEMLLARGARPDLFSHAMLGHLPVVRAMVEASPGIQSILGPHDFTLMHHARKGGAEAAGVVEYLKRVGGADPKLDSKPLAVPVAAFAGTYAWGKGTEDVLVVVVDEDGGLSVKYGEDFGRPLTHVGDHAFRPVGSRSVRFEFELKGERAEGLNLRDHDVVLRARRRG